MDEIIARAYALLNAKGLTNWTIETRNDVNSAGGTIHSKNVIWLSDIVIPLLPDESVWDVILHEVSHAIVGRNHPEHGDFWVSTHKAMGGSGEQYIDVPEGFISRVKSLH